MRKFIIVTLLLISFILTLHIIYQEMSFIISHVYAITNIVLVFALGAIYSYVELLNIFKTARTFFRDRWGITYILLNGLISILALTLSFSSEINTGVIGSKILLAGTAALALLRTISLPMKHNNSTEKSVPMIEIILNYVKSNYNKAKYRADFEDIKPLMKGVDYQKAAAALPPLCAIVLNNLSEEDGKKMNVDIQKFLKIDQGINEIKCINLGLLLEKHVGFDVLKTTIDNIKEYISIDAASEKRDDIQEIDSLIKEFE